MDDLHYVGLASPDATCFNIAVDACRHTTKWTKALTLLAYQAPDCDVEMTISAVGATTVMKACELVQATAGLSEAVRVTLNWLYRWAVYTSGLVADASAVRSVAFCTGTLQAHGLSSVSLSRRMRSKVASVHRALNRRIHR